MTRKVYLTLLATSITFILSYSTVQSGPLQTVEEKAQKALQELLDNWKSEAKPNPIKIGVKEFDREQAGTPSRFAHHFRSAMERAVTKDVRCRAVEIDIRKLKEIEIEQKLKEAGMLNPTSSISLGKWFETDCILFGTEVETEHRVAFNLTLDNCVNREIVSAVSVEFVKDEIPRELLAPLSPKPPQQTSEAIDVLNKPFPTPPSTPDQKLQISIFPDRVANPIYKAGEAIRFHIQANMDCYVRVVDVQPDGKAYQIFPNRFQSDYLIHGNTDNVIPRGDDKFKLRIVPPFGRDLVIAFASTKVFDLPNTIQSKAAGPFEEILSPPKTLVEGCREKGLGIFQAGGQYAEARYLITTIPGEEQSSQRF